MTLVQQLCAVAQAFHEARKLSLGRISTLVFGDGTKLSGLMSQRTDLTTARYERAMQWFSDNWPTNTKWPDGIMRPAQAEVAA